MPDLKKRSYQEEIMDDLSDKSPALFRALKELDIINKWLGGNAITLNAVKKLFLKDKKKVWHIADLGSGSGEMLKRIVDIAHDHNIQLKCYGFDANPAVVEYAKEHCKEDLEIEFFAEDILADEFQKREFDIVLCTLFLHHFDESTLISLIHQLNKQSSYVIINDLHRHWFAYYSIKWITSIFSRSTMVKNDACLSVWRGFKKAELEEILKEAEIKKFQLSWKWAFRWKLVIEQD